MGDQAFDTKQSSTKKKTSDGRASAPLPKPPMSMSGADHTQFVDLLLQEVAEIARTSASTTEPKELVRTAAHAVGRARKAIAAYTIPDTAAPAPKQLFRTVDGAFMSLYDLFFILRDHKEAAVAQQAASVQVVLGELGERFEPAGWKAPKTDFEGHAREAAADTAGARNLTAGEKGTLGRLHIRAARQHILGAWKQILDGIVVPYAAAAAVELSEGMSLLIDPHLAGEANAVTAELEATEEVVARLFMFLEANNPIAIGGLQDLAKGADSLRGLVGLAPTWTTRVGSNGAFVKSPATTQIGGASTTAPLADKGATHSVGPRAEPPEHTPKFTQTWFEKVHLMDTNYFDEYLGYIELKIDAYKHASGQVYVTAALATKRLNDRAGQYLSMGADVVSRSVLMDGQHFADVFFDVQIGGPHTTETSTVGLGAKLSATSGDKSEGAEVSASATFSSAVSSQGTRSFRRVFRINGLEKPLQIMVPQGIPPYAATPHTVGMVLDERIDQHYDFDDFELDDDDVGDTVTSFNANWVLHSYSD